MNAEEDTAGGVLKSEHIRKHINFYRPSSYASAVLGVVIPSVCPSVRPSVTRVLCDKKKQCAEDILIQHQRTITLVFWHQQWLVSNAPSVWSLRSGWPTPFAKRRLRQISAYNVSTVKDDTKDQLWRIGSHQPWAFQRAIDGVRTLPLFLKVWLKKRFLFIDKIQFQSIKVCYKVSLCENFQRQSCSITIPLFNDT